LANGDAAMEESGMTPRIELAGKIDDKQEEGGAAFNPVLWELCSKRNVGEVVELRASRAKVDITYRFGPPPDESTSVVGGVRNRLLSAPPMISATSQGVGDAPSPALGRCILAQKQSPVSNARAVHISSLPRSMQTVSTTRPKGLTIS
jgi:hypothetical protein